LSHLCRLTGKNYRFLKVLSKKEKKKIEVAVIFDAGGNEKLLFPPVMALRAFGL